MEAPALSPRPRLGLFFAPEARKFGWRSGQHLPISMPLRPLPLMCNPRLDPEWRKSVAGFIGEEVLIAVPVDVARPDQRLELFWRQLLAGGLPLQLSDDLVHAASIMNALMDMVSSRQPPGANFS